MHFPSKEQLQKALRKKKECNDKAQRVVETLIEPGRTEDELLTLLKDINQCHILAKGLSPHDHHS